MMSALELLKILENSYPDIWRKCYPRIYEEPRCSQYYSPKLLAYEMVGTAVKASEGYLGECEKAELMWGSTLAKYRVPMYWLSRDIAEAIQQTIPPLVFNWYEAKLPLEGACFMLPKGVLTHKLSEEGDAVFVSYFRNVRHSFVTSLATGNTPNEIASENGIFGCFTYTSSGNHLLHWTYGGDKNPEVDLGRIDETLTENNRVEHKSNWIFQPKMTPDDDLFMAKAVHMIFGTILLMNAKPELITQATLRKRVVNRNTGIVNEFWTPNIIGEHYKIRRLTLPQGGSHASPRFHWVRGCWKDQPFGPRHSLRKNIWIEPYTRGVE